MNKSHCPFCDTQISGSAPDQFEACTECGNRSARVDNGDDQYLIIDSRLPDLIGAYTRLQSKEQDSVIIIDRRVGQYPIAGAERRR